MSTQKFSADEVHTVFARPFLISAKEFAGFCFCCWQTQFDRKPDIEEKAYTILHTSTGSTNLRDITVACYQKNSGIIKILLPPQTTTHGFCGKFYRPAETNGF